MKIKHLSFLVFISIYYLGNSQDTVVSLNPIMNDSIKVNGPDTLEALTEEERPVDYIELSNNIFKPNIKTILFHRDGWDLSQPLIKHNSGEKLLLSFDDLDGDVKDYMYTIVHCDADWKPSDLEKYEYIDGYFEDYFEDYTFSINTIQPYTHYELVFPTEDLIPTICGNYIMKIFIEDQDSLIFTRRFMIVDQKVTIHGEVRQATNLTERDNKQEIEFEIIMNGYRIINPYNDLKIVVQQNGRWDNLLHGLKPKMVVSNKLNYHNERENVFDGGNEFRSFSLKNLNYNTEEVFKIEFSREGYHAFLMEDKRRTFQVYKTEDDINGRFKIVADSRSNSANEAEYVYTQFYLPYPAPIIDGDIHIIGALTDWRFSTNSKMTYNYRRKGYEKELLLKQGYYNYQYVLLMSDNVVGNVSFIEGNHWETGNIYTIFVYNRDPGDYYDKLIGVKHINSRQE